MTVNANTLTVEGGAQIASSTAGPGKGGDIGVTVANGVTLAGAGPNGASEIVASALPGSSGQAGEVVLTAGGTIALAGGAGVTSNTAGAGNAGTVRVSSQGPLSLSDPGSVIVASATSTASGDAGSVTVAAPQITITEGRRDRQHNSGNGSRRLGHRDNAGGTGARRRRRCQHPDRRLGDGPRSGPGGSVTVNANTLTVEGGPQIASSTAGPGKGGDIGVTVANGVTLAGAGPNGASENRRLGPTRLQWSGG